MNASVSRIGRLYVENLTGATQYQGLFIASSTPGAAEAFLRRVNLKIDRSIPGADRPGLLWIRLEGDRAPRPDTPWYPVQFDQGYVEERRTRCLAFSPGMSSRSRRAPTSRGQRWPVRTRATSTYPPESGVTGQIRRGPPPGGDFVRPERVGVNYVSPWGEPTP